MPKFSRREVLQSGAFLTADSFLFRPAFAKATLVSETAKRAEDAGVIQAIPEIDLGPRQTAAGKVAGNPQNTSAERMMLLSAPLSRLPRGTSATSQQTSEESARSLQISVTP
jgi:hypothetical protein